MPGDAHIAGHDPATRWGDGVRRRPRHGSKLALGLVLAVGVGLRFSGIAWNLERHSAAPFAGPPTYHVDEAYMVEGLRTDRRLFNDMSITMDGPLVSNVAYVGTVLAGVERDRWDPVPALLAGRLAAAAADCLALGVVWWLLRALGTSVAVRLFALAAVAVAPNHVFNAHFARSHTIANVLQLLTMAFAMQMLAGRTPVVRALALFGSVLSVLLAASARYPFLSLGLFPAVMTGVVLRRAHRQGRLLRELGYAVPAGVAGLVAGVAVGFDLRPIAILETGLRVQATVVKQLPWSALGDLVAGMVRNLGSILVFPGGAVWTVLLIGAALVLPTLWRSRADGRWTFALVTLGWAVLYMVLWSKYGIIWQRYGIAFLTPITILGAVGIDGIVRRLHVSAGRHGWRFAPILGLALTGVVLASPAYLSALVAARFTADREHPLFQASGFLARLPASRDDPRIVFVHGFWGWNTPIADLVDPTRFALRFVPDLAVACEAARPGDLVLNLAFERLRGQCPDRLRLRGVFAASNLGPAGFPYPERHVTASWWERHYEDYHYLFQDVVIRQFVPASS